MSGESYESIWSHLAQVPFRQAWADVNGVSTRFVEAGDPAKPTVVFIHGIGGVGKRSAPISARSPASFMSWRWTASARASRLSPHRTFTR